MGDSNNDVKRSQNRLLNMAKTIAGIMERNQIPYSMVYGSFLGAVRHKGFIPWDDDFDFCIFDEYYDDVIKCLKEELPDDLFLEYDETEPLYFHAWPHVKDLRTETACSKYPQDNAYAHKGLSVDLYRFKKVRLADVTDEVIFQGHQYMERRRSKGLISDSDYNRFAARFEAMHNWFKNMYPNETEDSVKREVYANVYTSLFSVDVDDMFPLVKYKFEDTCFYGPNNADKILKHWYGDYMKLPPEEKRISHFDYVKFLQ